MKKLLTFLFIVIAQKSYTQNAIQSISETYFRQHPFDSKFSVFILDLQKDPLFTVKEYHRRTDSTFFFLSGTYKNFNPFRYTPAELRLTIAEEEIIYSDSIGTRDTIINLQLMGIIDSNMSTTKSVEKELKRFHQAYARRFDDFKSKTLKREQNTTGEIYSYFISPLSVSPVTVAWGILPDSYQYSFAIIIRFKVAENQAVYIVQPGD